MDREGDVIDSVVVIDSVEEVPVEEVDIGGEETSSKREEDGKGGENNYN